LRTAGAPFDFVDHGNARALPVAAWLRRLFDGNPTFQASKDVPQCGSIDFKKIRGRVDDST
jgi:hypothetical protein